MRIKVLVGVFASSLLIGCGPDLDDYPLPKDFCAAEGRRLSDEEKILRVLFDIQKGKYDGSHTYKTIKPGPYQLSIKQPKLKDIGQLLYNPDIIIPTQKEMTDEIIKNNINKFYSKYKMDRIMIYRANHYKRLLDKWPNDRPPSKDGIFNIGYVNDLYFLNESDFIYLRDEKIPRVLPFILNNCGEIFAFSRD